MSEQLPTYVGNCEIEETERGDTETDAYGLDTFVQEYQGRKDRAKVALFLKKLKAGATNSAIAGAAWRDNITPYPGFSAVSHSYRTDRAWAYFSVRFTGKFDNIEPPPQTSYSLNENTIQLNIPAGLAVNINVNGTIVPAVTEEGTGEIDYLSPRRAHRYATKDRPSTPRYGGAFTFGTGIQIIARRGLTQIIQDNTLAVEQRIYLVNFEQVQVGQWWQCAEEYELRLVQDLDAFSIPVK